MTREELLTLVNDKVDTTQFKSLSQKTINEELDDVLEDLGDDESANDKIVTKLSNRLKRMDGNLHKNVSDEIRKSKADVERKTREKKADEAKEETSDERLAALEKKYEELIQAAEARSKAEARNAVLSSVKSGLKDKFDKGNLEINDFFLETALSKLEIPDSDVDVSALVSKAESIYTSDFKRANSGSAIPRKGGTGSGGSADIDEHEFDDIVARRARRFGKPEK